MADRRWCECGHSEGLHDFGTYHDAEPCGMPGCDCDSFRDDEDAEDEDAGYNPADRDTVWDANDDDDPQPARFGSVL